MKTLWLTLALGIAAVAAQDSFPSIPSTAPKADRYEIGIWRAGQDWRTVGPFQVTTFPVPMLDCGRLPREDADEAVPNPTKAGFIDPDDPTRMCILDIGQVVLGLPLGTGYHFAIRAVAPDATNPAELTRSPWAHWSKTFRRAPRGLPCASGPGVQFSGENDIDGKPVRLTICVSQ